MMAFLGIVDCELGEVKDSAERYPELLAAVEGSGGWEVPFEKHEGAKLRDAPDDYLRWAAGIVPETKGFWKFQQRAREELKRRAVV